MTGNSTPAAPSPLGEVTIMPLANVKPYPDNPRKVPRKAVMQCAESIREFGWQQPLVTDSDMIIIAGHTRYEAAKYLRVTEIPVIIASHLTPEQARAFRIVDNRTHDYTSWDYPLLISEMNGLDEDFAAILDLADWENIISQHEESQENSKLDFEPEITGHLISEFNLTVTFDSQESADKAAPGILDMPGVTNVVYSRR